MSHFRAARIPINDKSVEERNAHETLHILRGCRCDDDGPGRFLCACTRTREWRVCPAYVAEIPHGYRDWRWISSAHEAGNLNSIGAVLGNDAAIKAYREGKLPFPDGTMIVALHYKYVPSEENNKVFGQAQSFVPEPLRIFSS